MRDVNVHEPTPSKPGRWRIRFVRDDGTKGERVARSEDEARRVEKELWEFEAPVSERPTEVIVLPQGTRIYPPAAADGWWRVKYRNAKGAWSDTRRRTQTQAMAHARRVDGLQLATNPVAAMSATVSQLIDNYLTHMENSTASPRNPEGNALRYVEKLSWATRGHIEPQIGKARLVDWTPAMSIDVLTTARKTLAPSSVKLIGQALRALVTRARQLGWLPADRDPMAGVRYSVRGRKQGQSIHYVDRKTLPTTVQLEAIWPQLEKVAGPVWALGMELMSMSGMREGELFALRPCDISFEPRRIGVHWTIEQSAVGKRLKRRMPTKNRGWRDTIFPASIAPRLKAHVEAVTAAEGEDALLFPGPDGDYCDRDWFRRRWQKAARLADWPRKERAEDVKRRHFLARWSPEKLRDYAACWMIFDVKITVELVSDYLGHANAAFTMARYVGVRGDAVDQGNTATEDW